MEKRLSFGPTWRRVVIFADWSSTGSWLSINWVYAASTSCSSDLASNRFGTLASVRAIGIRLSRLDLKPKTSRSLHSRSRSTIQKSVSNTSNHLCFGFCLSLGEVPLSASDWRRIMPERGGVFDVNQLGVGDWVFHHKSTSIVVLN